MNTLTKHLTLLYVEDHKETRNLTKILLEQYFDLVIIATNGEDGLQKFQEYPIDLIITDIHMPKLDGIAMIQKIRELNDSVPILIVSAHNDNDYLMESIQQSVQGYLIKPIKRKQFKGTISKIKETILKKHFQERNEYLLQQYQDIIDDSTIISKTDPNGIITYANDAFCNVSGYSREELIGQNHSIIRYPKESKELFKDLWYTIAKKKQTWKGLIRNQTKEGTSYYVQTTIKPILNKQDVIEEFIASRTVITDIIRTKEKFQQTISSDRNQILNMVKEAINTSNIISHFQPIIENRSKKVIKYESLVRIIDKNKHLILPHVFLGEIKNEQCHTEVTNIILSNSFKALSLTDVAISINVSISDIMNKTIQTKIIELLKLHKKESHRITFELLEDDKSESSMLLKNFILEVRKYNVKIAIDDFGVGYSNFERIMQYKPDIIKIDGSIIQNITSDTYSRNLVEAIVMFAKKENILTTAEFVENQETFDMLNALGVDNSQGYFFGRPQVLF